MLYDPPNNSLQPTARTPRFAKDDLGKGILKSKLWYERGG